ncbi:MAG: hypothetical protein RQ826_01040 [Xanthomonadales bacterium]|nr:hypothetical protein [Xanthomonadales bacterium]
MNRVFTVTAAALLALAVAMPLNADNRQNLKKEALTNERLPNFGDIFNWGLKIKNLKELYLFAGVAAQDDSFAIVAPNDYVEQTTYILNELDLFLEESDLTRDDIIRIEFTLVEGISDDDFNSVLGQFAGYFADVEVKPAAGTLRFVSGLAFPGLVVVYEIWAAR